MADTTLHDALISEVRDMYDAERQLTKALPRMAKAANSEALRDALTTHLEETRGQIEQLEQVFESLEERPRGKHCAGMAGIIEEGKHAMEEEYEGAAMDAVLIASAQRAEHYEIAAYGTMVAWARALGLDDVATTLEGILDQEKAADESLSGLAEAGINDAATAGATEGDEGGAGDEDEDDEEDEDNMEDDEETGDVATETGAARTGAAKSAKKSSRG